MARYFTTGAAAALILFFVIVVFMVSCAKKPEKEVVVIPSPPVEIPTTEIILKECPAAPEAVFPKLAISETTEETSNKETAKNLILSIVELQKDVEKLNAQLDAYRRSNKDNEEMNTE